MTQTEFKSLYQEHFQPMVQFAYSLLDNKQEALDIVQEVFLKIWNQAKNGELKLLHKKAYLFTAVKNKCYTANKGRFIFTDIDEVNKETSEIENPIEKIENQEMAEMIALALQKLPKQNRIIFQLSKQAGLKNREIATLLKISIKTVENQMTIAFKKLRENLKYL